MRSIGWIALLGIALMVAGCESKPDNKTVDKTKKSPAAVPAEKTTAATPKETPRTEPAPTESTPAKTETAPKDEPTPKKTAAAPKDDPVAGGAVDSTQPEGPKDPNPPKPAPRAKGNVLSAIGGALMKGVNEGAK
jgi:cytoskeletal protein RodZ